MQLLLIYKDLLRDDQVPERAFISIVQPMSFHFYCRQQSHILTAHMSSNLDNSITNLSPRTLWPPNNYSPSKYRPSRVSSSITSAWMQTSPGNKEAQAFSESLY